MVHTLEDSDMNGQFPKKPTGVQGMDEIMGGGLPEGRPTLLFGNAGSGKTLMAMEFIANGAINYGENGVFLSFEESKDDLYANVASLGIDLAFLEKNKQVFINEIDMGLDEIVEAGDYNLGGLFSQINYAVESINAERIVIDGIESLFSYFSSEVIIRKELKRLFKWLKQKKLTAIITSEMGDRNDTTRHGIEDYLSDCVIFLDHRLKDQIATRRLHIRKYRGSIHGTNEYPFLITDKGISIFPITSMTLDQDALKERVSSGIANIDNMLGGKGYYKGSSVLISGNAGTGKSSFSASFASGVCEKGDKCIYFAFEEPSNQIIRNMSSIGMNLQKYIDQGLLKIHAARPMLHGVEMHLLTVLNIIKNENPAAVIFDPISNMHDIGEIRDVKMMFIRIIDYLKNKGITGVFTNLTQGGGNSVSTEVGVSSVMDTWILLQHRQVKNLRERTLYIMKSRGIKSSGKIHKFQITDNGIEINEG